MHNFKISGKISSLLLLIFLLLSFFQHKKFINQDIQGIHAWRQSITMWNVRNFVRHDSNILNPRWSHFNGGKDNIVRLEFPIMQWTIAMAQKKFGERIEVARTIVFLIGALSVLGIFLIVQLLTGNWLSALAAGLAFQYAPVFYYYTINPLPDMLALCSAVWYLFFILRFRFTKRYAHLILASIFLSLATLAKLPYLMFSIVSIYYFFNDIFKNQKLAASSLGNALIQLTALSPAFLWYGWVMPHWNSSNVLYGIFAEGLFTYENLRIFIYHLTEMFPLILLSPPVWILIPAGGLFVVRKLTEKGWFVSLMGITFLYLTLELNAINTYHDYYMLPFLPWLYILVGFGFEYFRKKGRRFLFMIFGIFVITAIYTPLTTAKNWSIERTFFNNDLFVHKEALKGAVPQDARCIILNDPSQCIFSYQIDKMGFVFDGDNLPLPWLEDMVNNYDVRYMYSDSDKINKDTAIARYIDSTLLVAGSIRVFKLKGPGLE